MARLESITFAPHRGIVGNDKVTWEPISTSTTTNLPNIFWKAGAPWREANLWAHERATSHLVRENSVWTEMSSLYAYANWLEESEVAWNHFPLRRADRCVYRFRGHLVQERDAGRLAPSTASARMGAVVRFYRWAKNSGLIAVSSPLWEEKTRHVAIVDAVGLERSTNVTTADLTIPNSRSPGTRLEDGLSPISKQDTTSILEYALAHASKELLLFLTCGFFTGMRLGTIADLKIATLENATPDPSTSELYRLAVGPGAHPSVHTKFDVTGQVLMPRFLLNQLMDYAYSVRRLKRQVRADPGDRATLFLTRFGNRYSRPGSNRSSALNVELSLLRRRAQQSHVSAFTHFHFHQTRATFATELARIAVQICGPLGSIALVREALMHKSEATTLRYIRFAQQQPIKAALADEFTRVFLGLRPTAGSTGDA